MGRYLMQDSQHDRTIENTQGQHRIAEEVYHSVGDGTRSETAFADHEDDGDDAEQDHRAEAIQKRVMETDGTMIAAHEDSAGDDLEPGWDATTPQLFHEEAAHRQLFTEGQETLDRMRFACIGQQYPEYAVDDADDNGCYRCWPPPSQVPQRLTVFASPPHNKTHNNGCANGEADIQVERGQEEIVGHNAGEIVGDHSKVDETEQ